MPTPKARYEIVADDKTKAAWNSAMNNADNFSKKLTAMFKGPLLPAAAIASVTAFGKSAVDAALEMDDLADRMQVGVGSASKMAAAFERLDGTNEGLEKGFKQLRLSIVDAMQGKDGAVNAFERIGVNVEALSKMQPEEQLVEIARGFESLHDPIMRTSVAQELFSKSGDEWIAVLGKGSAAMRDYVDAAVELDARAVTALENTSKATENFWRTIKTNFSNNAGTVIADMFGSGDELLDLQAKLGPLMDRLERVKEQPAGRSFLIPQLEEEIAKVREQINEIRLRNLLAGAGSDVTKGFVTPGFNVPEPNVTIEADPKVAAMEEFDAWQSAIQAINRERTESATSIAEFEKELNAEGLEFLKDSVRDGSKFYDETWARSIRERQDMEEDLAQRGHDLIYWSVRDGFESGADSAAETFRRLLQQMAADAAAAGIADALFGNTTDKDPNNDTGWVQGLFGAIGSYFGGGGGADYGNSGMDTGGGGFSGPRAMGGPVDAGSTYLVGERGPELFTPKSSGQIVPNNKLGGVTYTHSGNIYIGAGNNVTQADVRRAMQSAVATSLRAVSDVQRRGRGR